MVIKGSRLDNAAQHDTSSRNIREQQALFCVGRRCTDCHLPRDNNMVLGVNTSKPRARAVCVSEKIVARPGYFAEVNKSCTTMYSVLLYVCETGRLSADVRILKSFDRRRSPSITRIG